MYVATTDNPNNQDLADQRPARRSFGRWLIVVGIIAVSVNLRPAVSSLGTVLGSVRSDLGMSGFLAGLLTALPVVCFAAFGAAAPALARRLGMYRLILLGLLAIVAGLTGRAAAPGSAVFVVASVVSLVGIAVANIILPVLIKRHFPERIGFMTGVYSTCMAVGTALPAAVTVPVAGSIGYGWRGGLALWAVVAVAAVLPWVVLARQPRLPEDARDSAGGGDGASERDRGAGLRLLRSPTAWGVTGFFGLQSLAAYSVMGWLPQIYRAAGASPELAGYLLAFATMLAIPIALILPTVAARRRNQGPYVVALTGCGIAGYLGLAIAPAAHPWLWALLLGLLNCSFPLALTMIGLRARHTASVTQLSGFAQGAGYSVAALGPLGMGALHEVTGGWRVPIGLLLGFVVIQLVAGLVAARDRYVDDESGVQSGTESGAQEPRPAADHPDAVTAAAPARRSISPAGSPVRRASPRSMRASGCNREPADPASPATYPRRRRRP